MRYCNNERNEKHWTEPQCNRYQTKLYEYIIYYNDIGMKDIRNTGNYKNLEYEIIAYRVS